ERSAEISPMTEVVGHDPGRKPRDHGKAPKRERRRGDEHGAKSGPRREPPRPENSRAGSQITSPTDGPRPKSRPGMRRSAEGPAQNWPDQKWAQTVVQTREAPKRGCDIPSRDDETDGPRLMS